MSVPLEIFSRAAAGEPGRYANQKVQNLLTTNGGNANGHLKYNPCRDINIWRRILISLLTF